MMLPYRQVAEIAEAHPRASKCDSIPRRCRGALTVGWGSTGGYAGKRRLQAGYRYRSLCPMFPRLSAVCGLVRMLVRWFMVKTRLAHRTSAKIVTCWPLRSENNFHSRTYFNGSVLTLDTISADASNALHPERA
jgi:hypothetical protein